MSAKERAAVLIAVRDPMRDAGGVERSLEELRQLVEGLGIRVIATVTQRRASAKSPTYLGEGKLKEVAAMTGGTGVVTRGPEAQRRPHGDDASRMLVVADDELTPGQIRSLELALDAEILDRTGVILQVFEARARSREAKLEVELARLEYELPRIRDDHSLGDKEGGGGRASRGHSNVELAKQRTRSRIASLRRELERLQKSGESSRRSRSGTASAALVGYTNAGKSTLMRLLTGSEVLVEDKLFATLGTTVRQLAGTGGRPIVVADTVGFISRLPHQLLASFRSTLGEARDADLLLLVVDASDPAWREQLGVTRRVLSEVGAEAEQWVVFNKIDRCSEEARAELSAAEPSAICTCGLDRVSGGMLRDRIAAFFREDAITG